MKKLHIVALILVAVAIAGIVISASNYTTYEGFTKSKENPGKVYKIVGYLDTDEEMIYEPEIDPNKFTFHMIDKDSVLSTVIYKAPKPQDFERSEQIVVTGKTEDDVFIADEMLMKCPSKYVEDEVKVKSSEEAL